MTSPPTEPQTLRLSAAAIHEAMDLHAMTLRRERLANVEAALRLASSALESTLPVDSRSGADSREWRDEEGFLGASALLLEALRREDSHLNDGLAVLAMTCLAFYLGMTGKRHARPGPMDLSAETTRSLAILVAALLSFAGHQSRPLAEAACECLHAAAAGLSCAAAWRAFFPGLFSRLHQLCCHGKSRRVASRALESILASLCVFASDELPENRPLLRHKGSDVELLLGSTRTHEQLSESADTKAVREAHELLVVKVVRHLPEAARVVFLDCTPAESLRAVCALRSLLLKCRLVLGEALSAELVVLLAVPYDSGSPELRSLVTDTVAELRVRDAAQWPRLRGHLLEHLERLLRKVCDELPVLKSEAAAPLLDEALGLCALVGDDLRVLAAALSTDAAKTLRQLARLCEVPHGSSAGLQAYVCRST